MSLNFSRYLNPYERSIEIRLHLKVCSLSERDIGRSGEGTLGSLVRLSSQPPVKRNMLGIIQD